MDEDSSMRLVGEDKPSPAVSAFRQELRRLRRNIEILEALVDGSGTKGNAVPLNLRRLPKPETPTEV